MGRYSMLFFKSPIYLEIRFQGMNTRYVQKLVFTGKMGVYSLDIMVYESDIEYYHLKRAQLKLSIRPFGTVKKFV